jgi:hypothetical protein
VKGQHLFPTWTTACIDSSNLPVPDAPEASLVKVPDGADFIIKFATHAIWKPFESARFCLPVCRADSRRNPWHEYQPGHKLTALVDLDDGVVAAASPVLVPAVLDSASFDHERDVTRSLDLTDRRSRAKEGLDGQRNEDSLEGNHFGWIVIYVFDETV